MKMKKRYFDTSETVAVEGNSDFIKQKKEPKCQELENDHETTNNRNLKSARLIVRNLSFKANEDSIKKHFSTCGEVTDINLLKKNDRLVGCCFVQFDKKTNAAKAIARLSGKEFLGRPIVVDWAIAKDTYNKTIRKHAAPAESPAPVIKEEIYVKEENDDSEVDEQNSDIDSEVDEDEDLESSDCVEEDSENSEIDEKESDEEAKSPKILNNVTKIKREKKDKKYHFQYDPEDVNDGRTVFFKNVPFSANDDDLLECAKKVGSVVYAVICVDPLTEHSKGTAFIKFNEKSVVDDIILGKQKLVLKGEKLDAFLALKKTQITNLKEDKRPKDNRNLYLLREGLILAGSPAAEGVSESDMNKRLQLEHWKTKILKNLNKFVSSKRLVIHNVPPFYDDDKLKQVVKENSPKGSVVSECRIMRNMRDINEKGLGKSKGFGFISFSRHEDALGALRKMNNNPTIFIDKKRPIVGFSIENRTALRIQEKRKEKSKNVAENKSNGNVNNKKKGNINKNKQNESNNETVANNGAGKKRKFVDEDNLPMFCGYTAKPGAKKMRSGRELSSQAALHHKAIIDKKKSLKRKKFFSRRNSKQTRK